LVLLVFFSTFFSVFISYFCPFLLLCHFHFLRFLLIIPLIRFIIAVDFIIIINLIFCASLLLSPRLFKRGAKRHIHRPLLPVIKQF
jgi:hypothetical protein